MEETYIFSPKLRFEGKISCFNVYYNNKILLSNCCSFSYIKDLLLVIRTNFLVYVYKLESFDIVLLRCFCTHILYEKNVEIQINEKFFLITTTQIIQCKNVVL